MKGGIGVCGGQGGCVVRWFVWSSVGRWVHGCRAGVLAYGLDRA